MIHLCPVEIGLVLHGAAELWRAVRRYWGRI